MSDLVLSGPCAICGATNYALSCGGPTICPPCDCGDYGQATVARQTATITALRGEVVAAAQAIATLRKECFALAADTCHAGYGDEYGHHRCKEVDEWQSRALKAEAELAEAVKAMRSQDGMEYFGQRFDRAMDRAEAAEARLKAPTEESGK